ncbi:LysR family transcriptional regulator [Phreatobacter stygius]|uniref:LysR family transcriptional regulator n=1 Tax=Phreatobacter stygius TaxID=1940610 RepID=A0A4D7B9B4_9HYPH|nr:LysR family transcriptional regulator [Phreatobacter stygius]QCI67485.1 LysR family transcriptional regulator [Phreatobacter stygius]
MTQIDPSWDLYRTFLAVMDEGSLSGAARTLGLAQPTIGRHVDTLEQALGLELFTRSQHGLAPTDAAVQLRPYAESLAATTAALVRAASGEREAVHGVVRIAASEVIGVEVLPPILTPLRQRYPGLVIELTLSSSAENLIRREADIAVRMFKPRQEALVARHIGRIEVRLHAHRRYLDRAGTPTTVEDLAGHTLIGFDKETAAIRSMSRRVAGFDRTLFGLRADSDLAQLAMIRAGYGIGGCQIGVAKRDPALVLVVPEAFQLTLDTWVAMHEDLRSSRRCRVVFDALVAGLGDYIKWQDAP